MARRTTKTIDPERMKKLKKKKTKIKNNNNNKKQKNPNFIFREVL